MSVIEAVKSSSDVNIQSTPEITIHVFEDLRENRPKGLEESVLTSLKQSRQYTSFPNAEAIPSVAYAEMQILTDSRLAESANSEVMTPTAVGDNDIESLLPVSSTLPPVQPVDFDVQQLSLILNTETQLIGEAESKNLMDHETTGGLQDMVTRGEFGDAARLLKYTYNNGFATPNARAGLSLPSVITKDANWRNLRIKGGTRWETKLMGLRSSSLAKKNDDTLTWVLHRRDLCQQEPDQKPHETKSYGGSTSSEYRGRRHNNHVQRKRRNHVHSNILDYGKPEQTYGYGISDLDDFLSKSSIGRPGNIPMVLCTGCLLYQTQLDDHYQTEVALPLGMVVNAVFKNEQWLYVQTPHAEEGYIPYGSCLPLGIVPPPDAARAPCWETQSDVFPRPVGDRRRRGRSHRGGSVGGFGSVGGGGADDYDEDDQDDDDDDDRDMATLLFRRRHCGRGQSSPPPPLRRPTAATRSVTGYGYL